MISPPPRLTPIDLSFAEGHECPGLIPGRLYLVKFSDDPQLYCGTFTRQWYGLNFGPWINGVGRQFDAPGYNHSRWQAVWLVEHDLSTDAPKPPPRPNPDKPHRWVRRSRPSRQLLTNRKESHDRQHQRQRRRRTGVERIQR